MCSLHFKSCHLHLHLGGVKATSLWQAVGAMTAGTMLEWYDYFIYGTAAAFSATDRGMPSVVVMPPRYWWSPADVLRGAANGGAQCGKSACCVRRGGDWKRGTVE
jgi:hypothetical protein